MITLGYKGHSASDLKVTIWLLWVFWEYFFEYFDIQKSENFLFIYWFKEKLVK